MKRPRGRPVTINFKAMSKEEKRLYINAVGRRYNARKHTHKVPVIDFGDQRKCTKCEVLYERSEKNFYKNKTAKFGLSRICKTCSGRASKEWIVRNKFGGTLDEYEAIMSEAACAVCGATKRLALDHCHDKNHVRGVLCMLCNTGLGMFADEPDRLRRAATYLEERRNGLPD